MPRDCPRYLSKRDTLHVHSVDRLVRKLFELQVMGDTVQFEHTLIRERQREDIAATSAQDKQLGGKPKLTGDKVAEIRQRVAEGV